MPASETPRILFDLSWTMRWSGPPVGILRAEHELARWARQNLPAMTGVFFDPLTQRYCALEPAQADRFLRGDAVLDTLGLPDPARRRKTDRLPAAIKPLALWVLQFRRKLLQALERIRLGGRPGLASFADRLQRRLMGAKQAAVMIKPDGSRRDHVPADMMVRRPVDWRESDILVGAGAGWSYSNIAAIRAEKQAHGFRFALLCYDIIPILFPQFYKTHDVAAFRAYFDLAFATADLVVVTARRVEADVRTWCAERGLALGRMAQVPLGSNIREVASARPAALPAGLVADRFALFVSTIEPRKGHRTLYEAWLRLLADGVPQKTGFKLAFVGRPGWMVDDLMRDLRGERVGGSLVMLEMVDDATMAALYRGAAFCCYPSVYEGYGLPVVEAFRFGKAVLASSGGALPEVTGDYSPILDPDDVEAWSRALRDWIEHPKSRAPYEERIRSFRHPTWDEAAAQFFACVRTLRSGNNDEGSGLPRLSPQAGER